MKINPTIADIFSRQPIGWDRPYGARHSETANVGYLEGEQTIGNFRFSEQIIK